MTTLRLTSNRVPKKKLFAAPIPEIKANPVKQKLEANPVKQKPEANPVEPKPQPLPVVDPPKPVDLELLSPVFAKQLPLAIGIHLQIFAAFPELSKKLIRKSLTKHCVKYRWTLEAGMQRFNLDGSPGGLVTVEQCKRYAEWLNGVSESKSED